MSAASIIAAVMFPALLWGAYHYYRDRRQPEPITHAVLAIAAGAAGGLLGQGLYRVLDWLGLWRDAYALAQADLVALFAYAVLGIGVIEETAKLIPFALLALTLKAFDERVDGIIYSGLVALGFAAFENVFYLEFATPAENLARAFTGPLVHIVFASLWGYPIGLAVLARRMLWLPILTGITAAVVLHGVYDFCVLGLPGWARFAAALIIVAAWLRNVHLVEYVIGGRAH